MTMLLFPYAGAPRSPLSAIDVTGEPLEFRTYSLPSFAPKITFVLSSSAGEERIGCADGIVYDHVLAPDETVRALMMPASFPTYAMPSLTAGVVSMAAPVE